MLRLVLIIGFIAVLAACTGNQPTPVVEQASLSGPVVVTSPVAATDVPQKVTPVPSATPTATAVPPPNTPTPKPSLEDLLLDNARHIHGAEDAPVTFIEFSDFK